MCDRMEERFPSSFLDHVSLMKGRRLFEAIGFVIYRSMLPFLLGK